MSKGRSWRATVRTMLSSCCIQRLGRAQYPFPQERAEGAWCHEVDSPASEELGQLHLDPDEAESRDVSLVELDEDVDIARGPEVVPEDRPER